MDWKMYLYFIVPMLEATSKSIAAKDANTTGTDDKIAQVLHWSYLATNAILNDREIPPVPTILAGNLADGDVAGALRILSDHHSKGAVFDPNRSSVVTDDSLAALRNVGEQRGLADIPAPNFAEGLARREQEILSNKGLGSDITLEDPHSEPDLGAGAVK